MLRGRKFFGKCPTEKVLGVYGQMFSMPFGVNIPQQFEEDEGIYYTDVYQSDIDIV